MSLKFLPVKYEDKALCEAGVVSAASVAGGCLVILRNGPVFIPGAEVRREHRHWIIEETGRCCSDGPAEKTGPLSASPLIVLSGPGETALALAVCDLLKSRNVQGRVVYAPSRDYASVGMTLNDWTQKLDRETGIVLSPGIRSAEELDRAQAMEALTVKLRCPVDRGAQLPDSGFSMVFDVPEDSDFTGIARSIVRELMGRLF